VIPRGFDERFMLSGALTAATNAKHALPRFYLLALNCGAKLPYHDVTHYHHTLIESI